jgi:hypothetical protein
VQRAAALAHIYPPPDYPYRDDAVREQWRWGTGVADELHAAAVERGARKLWCLEDNRETRVVPFPPHPLDGGYSLNA